MASYSLVKETRPQLQFFIIALILFRGLGQHSLGCEHCPVTLENRSSARINWIPQQVEACQLLSIPEVSIPDSTLWGTGVAVDGQGRVLYSGYYNRAFAIRRLATDSLRLDTIPTWATLEKGSADNWVRIDELTWDPIHNLLWGASRLVLGRRDARTGGLPRTRIYTIEIDTASGRAECTYRFDGLGVPGTNYPCTGLTFDPHEGLHGTLWQHIEDGGNSYSPFPITAELNTTGPGTPVFVEAESGSRLVSGICVSPDGKRMYVSHGVDGTISLHDKWTGLLVATLGAGPVVPRRATRGLEVDYSRTGCPRLLCHEALLRDEYGPVFIVAYSITDQ